MDRGSKSVQSRGGKSKTPQYPADLFALGAKSATEPKRPGVVHSKPSTSHVMPASVRVGDRPPLAGPDRKREASGAVLPGVPVPPKKPKPAVAPAALGRSGAEAWEMLAIDCEPLDLVPLVVEASDQDENDRVVGLLCGAIRTLRAQRWKPDMVLYLGLCYLAKLRPALLASDCVPHALASLLRRDATHSFKTKGNPVMPVFAANLLLKAFLDRRQWPELFVKLYVEDALAERVWVDQEDCSGFVANILTALNTRQPARGLLQPEAALPGTQRAESCSSPSAGSLATALDDDSETGTLGSTGSDCSLASGLSSDTKEKMDIPVVPRFVGAAEAVEAVVMEAVREQLNRRQPAENITRNFLRLLATCCGLVEVRATAAPRLELWLQNPKLMRPAQELLLAVCLNCSTHSQRDVEVVSHLVKIRLKTKALINLYLTCIRELISVHPDNLATVLKHTLYNELSTARNPNNMAMLAVMFQAKPDEAAALLADIFLELLMNREDYLRPLRALLREVVRVLRHDISLQAFCRGLLNERKDTRDFDFKERMFVAVADLVTLCVFLGISPAVREASVLLARGDKREIATLQNFHSLVSRIQRDAVWWLHDVAPRVYRPAAPEFVHALHKVLFVEHPDQYHNKDNWPPENERGLFLRLSAEAPLQQQTLMGILLMGLSKEHLLAPPDALELADQLVKRAAGTALATTDGAPSLQADKLDMIDLVFNLTAYHHPDNINLPAGYCPPQLAVTNYYWKAWVMLLIMSAHNPATFGAVAWEKYPTLRAIMEMCITNHFQFPPPTLAAPELVEEARSKELQLAALERQQVLEFESHLAAASTKQTITEQTSLLLSQLIALDATGPPRQPPPALLEQLRQLNTSHRLGHLLCRSRRPDFLLDTIQRQGASQSMPWLADLVESSEGAFSHLPVQCLCEFLLSSGSPSPSSSPALGSVAGPSSASGAACAPASPAPGSTAGPGAAVATVGPEKQQKQQQLLHHLRAVLTDPAQDPAAPCEVLEYFLRRLGSAQTAARAQAIRGLHQVLGSGAAEPGDEPMDLDPVDAAPESCGWLLRALPQLPHFPAVRPQAVQALRQACQVENEPGLVSSYICFLSRHADHDSLPELADLVLDMAQLIVERSSIVAVLLPAVDHEVPGSAATRRALMLMFNSFLQKAREPRQEGYPWSDSHDQVLVTWSTGEQALMHVLIVHALVILLNYGPMQDQDELYDSLLELWFPLGRPPPRAYLVVTSEEAILFPDWLKLRMIRSNVDRLVDAALTDLDPNQLVLFVQSFGIPVRSMSKLLFLLDRTVVANPAPLADVALDKIYMAQLVEVQRLRGAQGGCTLVQVLHLEQPQLPDYEPQGQVAARRPVPSVAELSAMLSTRASSSWRDLPESPAGVVVLLQRMLEPATGRDAQVAASRQLQWALSLEAQRATDAVPDCPRPLMEAAAAWLNAFLPPEETQAAVRAAFAPLLRLLQALTSARAIMRSSKPKTVPPSQPYVDEDPVQYLHRVPVAYLEHAGDQLLQHSLQSDRAPVLVQGLASLLLEGIQLSSQTDTDTELHTQTERQPDTQRGSKSCSQVETQMDTEPGTQLVTQPSLQSSSECKKTSLPKRTSTCIQTGTLQNLSVDTKPNPSLSVALESVVLSPAAHTGLLIDWLASVEPELIGLCPDLQMQLLFARLSTGPRATRGHCRPYLLSLLTHRSGWTTLHRCVATLLQPGAPARFSPVAVLDFLSALTHNPRLWQGRDRFSPKHHQPSDVLCLDTEQVLTLVEYVVAEAEQTGPRQGRLDGMEARLCLLQPCLATSRARVRAVCRLLSHLSAGGETSWRRVPASVEPKPRQLLLLLLYLQQPALLQLLPTAEREWLQLSAGAAAACPSLLDTCSHTVLTALTAWPAPMGHVLPNKDWSRRAHEYELLARKMASVHPVLVLRQLPLLATALQGRVHLELVVFRSRHHLALFNQVLGLLELLRPALFASEYSTSLNATLACYLALARRHGHAKDVSTLLTRVVALLQTFLAADAQRALRFLQDHAAVLSDLLHMHPSLSGLRALLASLTLPRAEGGDSPDTLLSGGSSAPAAAPTPHYGSLLAALCRHQGEEVFNALQELEHMSSRRPAVLEPFTDVLAELLSSPAGSVRSLANTLLLRYIRHDPAGARAAATLTTFMHCLDSDQPDVVSTTLDRMPEVIMCAQEHALPLMQKAFHLGMSTGVCVLPSIIKTIGLLNVQAGC